jgi:FkbM family methyltransferase
LHPYLLELKELLRKLLIFLGLDVTKNIEYDRLTSKIFNQYLKEDSNCIDVGCHKGEILDIIIKKSPKGKHFAFEPIPEFYKGLESKYSKTVELFNVALSNESGETTFNYVKNAPAYSGIKERKYKVSNPDIEKLTVKLDTLDHLIKPETKIDLIKIDVEGGELNVLKGGKELITANRPLILFECGLGASEYYNTKPEEIFELIESYDLKLYTLKGFIQETSELTKENFVNLYQDNKEYYFVAK